MPKVRLRLAISLDGFVAGSDQSVEHPLGLGGMRLHEWAFATAAFRRGLTLRSTISTPEVVHLQFRRS